jgi:hypothetical protein
VWAAICPMCRVFLVTELIEAGAAPGSGVELSARELAEKGPLVEVACNLLGPHLPGSSAHDVVQRVRALAAAVRRSLRPFWRPF